LIPVGTPAADWNGIPIMPGALAGEGDELGYTFTTQSNAVEIQGFYESKLATQGYELLAVGEGNANESVLLIFTKGEAIISLSIFHHEDLNVVLIVQS
jgi:hypothetical protein